jgi:hypothetical protein
MKSNNKYKYLSPFPDKTKNSELMQKTRSVYFKERDALVVHIPTQVTKSYMSTNRYYFDTEKWKNIHSKVKPKSAINTKVNEGYASWIVDLKNLEKVLSYRDDSDINDIINKELDWKHDTDLKVKETNKSQLEFHRSLSPKRFLENIIESKYKPFFHKFYGKIPE